MTTFRRLGQSELLPRYIFAEGLYARRRVLEVGAVASTDGESARFLARRGARSVLACDGDLAAVERAQVAVVEPNLRFRGDVFDDLAPGSFDLVIVTDLGRDVRAPELLAMLARLLAPRGYLLGGLRNPAGLALSQVMEAEPAEPPPTYGQLLDALAPHFPQVRVATQSPVLGYQLAFEKSDGDVIDGSLVGTPEAAYYVVLAGTEPVRDFGTTWVQLPPEPLAFTGGKLEQTTERARSWEERSGRLKEALAQAKATLATREQELSEAREGLRVNQDAVHRLTAQVESLTSRPEDRERDELAIRVRKLEADIQVSRDRAVDAEHRAAEATQHLEILTRAQKEAAAQALASQEGARLERARRDEVAGQLDDGRERLARAYEELRVAQDVAGEARVEVERLKLSLDRALAGTGEKERELAEARERELRLAEQQSTTLQAIERLERELGQARTQLEAAKEHALAHESTLAGIQRAAEADQIALVRAREAAAEDRARAGEIEHRLDEEHARLVAAETELAAQRGEVARLTQTLELATASQGLAQELEAKLAEATAALDEERAQGEALRGEREASAARASWLERDLQTAVGAERSARTQAEVALAAVQARLAEQEQFSSAERERTAATQNELGEALAGVRLQLQQLEQERLTLSTQASKQAHALEEERDEAIALREEALRRRDGAAARASQLADELAHLREALERAVSQEQSVRLARAATDEALTARVGELTLAQEHEQELERQVSALREELERVVAREKAVRDASDEQGRALEIERGKRLEWSERFAAAELAAEDKAQALAAALSARDEAASKVARLEDERAQLEQARAESASKVSALEQALAQEQSARERATAESLARVTPVEQAMAEERARRESADARAAALEQALAEERTRRESASEVASRVVSLEQMLADERAAREADVASRLTSLEQTLAEERTARHAEASQWSEIRAQQEGAHAALERQLAEERRARQESAGEAAERAAALELSLAEARQAKEAASSMAARLAELEQVQLENDGRAAGASLEALKEELDLAASDRKMLQSQVSELELELSAAREACVAADGANAKLQTELEASRAQPNADLERLEFERAHALDELETATAEQTRLQRALEAAQQGSGGEVAKLRDELQRARSASAAGEAEGVELRAIAADASLRTEQLAQELAEYQSRLEALQQKLNAQETELASLRRPVAPTSGAAPARPVVGKPTAAASADSAQANGRQLPASRPLQSAAQRTAPPASRAVQKRASPAGPGPEPKTLVSGITKSAPPPAPSGVDLEIEEVEIPFEEPLEEVDPKAQPSGRPGKR